MLSKLKTSFKDSVRSSYNSTRNEEELNEILLQHLLINDLTVSSQPSLPNNLPIQKEAALLNGWHVLQVESIQNVGEAAPQSYEEKKPIAKKKLLKLQLSDGYQVVNAIEQRPITSLSVDSAYGTKIFVGFCQLRYGCLLLHPGNIEVLGGRIDKESEGKVDDDRMEVDSPLPPPLVPPPPLFVPTPPLQIVNNNNNNNRNRNNNIENNRNSMENNRMNDLVPNISNPRLQSNSITTANSMNYNNNINHMNNNNNNALLMECTPPTNGHIKPSSSIKTLESASIIHTKTPLHNQIKTVVHNMKKNEVIEIDGEDEDSHFPTQFDAQNSNQDTRFAGRKRPRSSSPNLFDSPTKAHTFASSMSIHSSNNSIVMTTASPPWMTLLDLKNGKKILVKCFVSGVDGKLDTSNNNYNLNVIVQDAYGSQSVKLHSDLIKDLFFEGITYEVLSANNLAKFKSLKKQAGNILKQLEGIFEIQTPVNFGLVSGSLPIVIRIREPTLDEIRQYAAFIKDKNSM